MLIRSVSQSTWCREVMQGTSSDGTRVKDASASFKGGGREK